ncbi:MAG: hypothetical protein KF764_11910 [Labilithrix sp.]|nr:hypothetical protein [Labilithrix sp.]MBX3223123.1 hypothetical protein [Labilithrix sp.]
MECAAHPGTAAAGSCTVCTKASCDRCLAFDIDGRAACAACGPHEEDRSAALGSALLTFVGVGYLAALAIGYLVFRARPFVGGLAAVVAIALGRALQLYLRPPIVTRRPSAPRAG